MPDLRCGLLLLCLAAPCTVPATAQDLAKARQGHGVHPRSDHVLATGPGFTARFDRAGFEFTPLLGAAAPQPMPLRTTLASVRRGDAVVFARTGDGPVPEAVGAEVHCRHGAVTESYLVADAGIEQRFVLAERPAGDGDLVVRLEVATGLVLVAADPAAGLHYAAPGRGGVTIGGVTGVDAEGVRAPGTIRVAGDGIEYVLPGAFVAAATFPLVVDPLFGAAFAVGDAPTGTDTAADLAFDATNLCWLVVWRVDVSANVAEVRAQRVSYTGALLGGQILVQGSSGLHASAAHRPRVVNVNASDRFLVGWVTRSDNGGLLFLALRAVAVDAATGASSSTVTLYSTGPDDFVLGGDARVGVFGIGDKALLVHTDEFLGSSQVRAQLVQVPASGPPVASGAVLTLASGSQPYGPMALTRHAGNQGLWLVAWARTNGVAAPPYPQIEGCVIDGSGNVCTPVWTLATGQVQAPALATRGNSAFALAWRDDTTQRLRVRTILYGGACGSGTLTLGAAVDPVQASGFCSQPALDFAQDKYVLAWRHANLLSPTSVRMKSLDPATCAACSGEYAVETSGAAQSQPAVAAWWSGGMGLDDTALVAWESGGAIRARRYEATGGGSSTLLGGACGPGGGNVVGHQGAPVLGDATFALTLGSPTAPVLAAIVGLSNVSLACGPCTLVPNLDIVLAGPGPHGIPIPCDPTWIGVQFWTQWLLFAPGGCAILPDFGLSVAQRFTIGD
ncbi:MAG: hypothetical protein KF830_00170 [Planctomycetes bacterium]|nr:hypothetical protein [Planctomycetota bacterium]